MIRLSFVRYVRGPICVTAVEGGRKHTLKIVPIYFWCRIQVDTGVEKRIILPVTYSLAGAAAEAMKTAAPGTEAAARERVLVDARIGSWCIRHPEEPWGTLDPFNNDSTPTLDPELVELSV